MKFRAQLFTHAETYVNKRRQLIYKKHIDQLLQKTKKNLDYQATNKFLEDTIDRDI